MSQEIEIEFKNLLTKDEYQKLVKHFRSYKLTDMKQKNHYFETADFQLKESRAALRIREKKEQFQLTLKQPNPNGPGLLETHCDITTDEAQQWIKGHIIAKDEITKALHTMNINLQDLTYGGMLETYRLECMYNNTTVVLDQSHYNGHTDYELELEAQDEQHGKTVFLELLSTHQIPKRKTANKIERFYHTLKI
ncbi:CYTH domain-containing protein [Gracilibacillus salitolerans]|uniref:CYTH domain-containing protein n=1 Tax=Gracilibacillus salitolerans TaxID=2663022 RepID=A0A5Q2TKX4_9BACI|nr:CYTH domain-containing protein [Gracilibacillus salitolerans]QGH35614.1 CYTH domain-containing protein [Gracilibacillus salitolerans]